MNSVLSRSMVRGVIETPLGTMRAVVDDRAVRLIDFRNRRDMDAMLDRVGPVADGDDSHPVIESISRELDEYFAGSLREFTTPIDPLFGTDFDRRAWEALCAIPFGETRSYGAQAQWLGLNKTASRAVGVANGRNFCSIVIPCHRVIGANGSMVGYGGGLERKKWLLEHERMSLWSP